LDASGLGTMSEVKKKGPKTYQFRRQPWAVVSSKDHAKEAASHLLLKAEHFP
jgi:hypothetical protein